MKKEKNKTAWYLVPPFWCLVAPFSKKRVRTAMSAKGFILVLVLFTVLIIATLIIGLLNLTAIDASLVKNHMCSLQAYYITEAGIADAIDEIRQNGPLPDSTWQQTFPAGTSSQYDVAVSQSSTIINCTGLAAASNFSRTLEVQVDITGGSSPYNVSIQKWKETVP